MTFLFFIPSMCHSSEILHIKTHFFFPTIITILIHKMFLGKNVYFFIK